MTYHDIQYINLDLLVGTKYNLNHENLDLDIIFPTEKMQGQSFNATDMPIKEVDNNLINGAYFNYNLTLTQDDHSNYLAGVKELDYATENGVYSYSFLFQSKAVNSNFSKVRNAQKKL